MKKPDLIIEKKNFITTSKDNILNHYDFHPKVFTIFYFIGIGKRSIWSRIQSKVEKYRWPMESCQKNTKEKYQATRIID